jgi:hypothetical protein
MSAAKENWANKGADVQPHRIPPLTDLLSALTEPAALVGPGGALSWANPAFRTLFAHGRVPGSLGDWEIGSPPNPAPLWEELRQAKKSVRRLYHAG